MNKDIAEITRIMAEQDLNDAELLGDIVHPDDRQADWLTANRYYKYYHAICTYLKPRTIGEIGMRRGYSSLAMVKGALAGGAPIEYIKLFTFDNQCYVQDSARYCWDYFSRQFPELYYFGWVGDTQRLTTLEDRGGFDLFNVDGDHSYEGTLHDLDLAFGVTKPDGVILVDDIVAGCSTVKPASDDFCAKHGLTPEFIDHYRGLYYIRIPS